MNKYTEFLIFRNNNMDLTLPLEIQRDVIEKYKNNEHGQMWWRTDPKVLEWASKNKNVCAIIYLPIDVTDVLVYWFKRDVPIMISLDGYIYDGEDDRCEDVFYVQDGKIICATEPGVQKVIESDIAANNYKIQHFELSNDDEDNEEIDYLWEVMQEKQKETKKN